MQLLAMLTTVMMLSVQAGQPWMSYQDPAAAGVSPAKLEEARAFAEQGGAAAVMAVYRGHVIASWGAVDRPLMAHSVRKSLAGALYGMAVSEGALSLTDTLESLGIDDDRALTAAERRATFGDLIASRSGVYHPAAYADAGQDRNRPARGSHAPGTFFFYNNWDFNAAEAAYERKTGESLYAAFDRRVARPLGMEDFDPGKQMEVLEPGQSRHPAHTFRISARDLARFGQLYLQEGRWNGRQLLPASWVRESFRKHSVAGERIGYGYLWWIYEPGSLGANYPVLDTMHVYLARGTGGQTVFVIPSAELVVVVRGDTDNGRQVRGPAIWGLVERFAAARDGIPAQAPALVPMVTAPLASTVPAPSEPVLVPLAADARRRLVGTYEVAPGAAARVFEHDGRLFMSIPGQGEAELFATSPLTFVVKVQAGVTVTFQEANGAIQGVEVVMGRGQTIKAARRQTP